MRYVAVAKLKENDIVARDIRDGSGRMLVSKDARLNAALIDHLKKMGFRSIYIEDEISKDIEVPEDISPELREKAKDCVRRMDVAGSVPVSKSIIEEMLRKHINTLNMRDVRSFDDFTYAHSINVAVLSCAVGAAMSLDQRDLFNLVNAAVLHDFGKMKVPEEIMSKTERLTGAEYEEVKKHVGYSYDIIKDRPEISEETKAAVRAHHENEDGSGYPYGLTSEDIPRIAKILHVADVYDALVSNRPYKKGFSPWEAVEYLMGGCGIIFSQEVVDTFIKVVPVYPLGSEIRLSNGEPAIVVANVGEHNLRPVVRLLRTGENLDLSQRSNLSLSILAPESSGLEKNEEDRRDMVEAAEHRRIIIVDDMKTNLQMLREILEPEYKVIPFKSGAQLIKYLEGHNEPDMIIMDIDMPEMSGTEAAKIVSDRYNGHIPILFVTALSDKNTVLTCRQLGAKGYIIRPYQPFYILSEVKRILDGSIVY